MKKIAFVLSMLASTFVLASCANQGTEQTTTVSNDNNTQAIATSVTPSHHDYKGEALAK